jgi:hypothetical protein
MADERLYMNTVNGWDKMDTALTANSEQLPHLEINLPRLREKSQRARSLYAQYAATLAAKQEIWKEMQLALREGDAVMKFLKEGVKAHYGKDHEKLVEFGVQPFRGLKRKRAEKPPVIEKPAPISDPAK